MLRDRRQERVEGRRLEHAHAEGVRDQHVAGAPRLREAGHAERGVGPELQRIAEVVVEAPEDDVHPIEPFQSLQEHPIVAHRQIAAFHQREAQVAGQVRVLEVRLGVRPRRE